MSETSYTLKAGDGPRDKWSIMIHDPNTTTLAYVREKAEQAEFLKKEDQFLNKDGAPVSDEGYAVSKFVTGTTISVQRFVPARPTAPAPATATVYTAKRGSESESLKIPATAPLKQLRENLKFMKPEYYFMLQDSRITDEDKWKVGDIAEDGTIQVGPTPSAPPKPAATPFSMTSTTKELPTLETKAWNNKGDDTTTTELLSAAKWTGGTAGTQLATLEYYKSASVEAKKQLFRNLLLDRGYIVKSGSGSPLAQSSYSPAWYVPSDEGPAPSTAGAESDTHGYWAAATKVLFEIRKRGFHQAAASGSWSDLTGTNGLQLKTTYLRDLEEYERGVSTEMYMLEERAVRKVILELSNRDLRPTAAFKYELAQNLNPSKPRIKQYEALHTEIFAKYGHFFPTQVVLGGRWFKEYQETFSSTTAQRRLIQELKVSGEGGGTTEAGTFKAGLAYGNYSDAFDSLQVVKQRKTQQAVKLGGNPLFTLVDDEPKWVDSLAPMANWVVIEIRKMLPIISLLQGDDAADELRQHCISLINEFATSSISESNTSLDMEAYVALLHAREAEKLSLI
jgi:Fungal MACPF-like domain